MIVISSPLKLISRFLKICSLLLIIAILLLSYARQIEPNLLLAEKQTIPILNLPDELTGIKIVQISDLHGKEFPDKRLVEKVNSLHPDLLVITGDVLDKFHNDYSYIERALGTMKAKYGKYFVTGNNEYTASLSMAKMEQAFQKANIKVLHNQSCRIDYKGKHLWLIGVDDPNKDRDNLVGAMRGTDNAPKLLLAHSPEIIDEASVNGIDLVLAGHTHGGQVWIPGIVKRPSLKEKIDVALEKINYLTNRGLAYIWRHFKKFESTDLPPQMRVEKPELNVRGAGKLLKFNMRPGFERYVSGLYLVGNTQMYVNRGIGETRIPFRFLTPPEITEIELITNMDNR